MRRQVEPHQAAQPWYRRYRVYLLIPLILGYAIIYGCRSTPLRLVRPTEAPYESINDSTSDEDGKAAHNEP